MSLDDVSSSQFKTHTVPKSVPTMHLPPFLLAEIAIIGASTFNVKGFSENILLLLLVYG